MRETFAAHELPQVPGFVCLECIGEGASGVVYRAREEESGDTVAVKILQPERGPADEEARKRFRREADALARMSHPNVVHLYGHGELPDGRIYLAMELLEGSSMDTLCKQAPLEEARAVELIAAVAAALAHSHARGIVHRDLKPANVFLSGAGEPKLGDFGLAMDARAEVTRLTRSGVFLGTPMYAAPEVLEGKEASQASDVYSLALILWVLLTGDHPYGWVSDLEALLRRISEPAGDLPAGTGEDRVRQAVHRALDQDPSERPSAEEFGALLRGTTGRPSTSTGPVPVVESGSQGLQLTVIARRFASSSIMQLPRRLGFRGGLLFLLALVGLGIWLLMPPATPSLVSTDVEYGPLGVRVRLVARNTRAVDGVGFSPEFRSVGEGNFVSEWLPSSGGPTELRLELVGSAGRSRFQLSVGEDEARAFHVLDVPPEDTVVLGRHRVPYPALPRGLSNVRLAPSFEIAPELLDDLVDGWPSDGVRFRLRDIPEGATRAVLAVEVRGGARPGDVRFSIDGEKPMPLGPKGERSPFPLDPQLRVLTMPISLFRGGDTLEVLPPEGGRPRGRFAAAWVGAAGDGRRRGGDLHVILSFAQALVTQLDRRIEASWDSLYQGKQVLDGLMSRGSRWTRLNTLMTSPAVDESQWFGRIDRLRALAAVARERIRTMEPRTDREKLEYFFLLHRSMVAFHAHNPVLLKGNYDVWAADGFTEIFRWLRKVAFSKVQIPADDPDWARYDKVVGGFARRIEGRYRAWAEYLQALGHLEARTNYFMDPRGLRPRIERLIDLAERVDQEWQPGTAGRAAYFVDLLDFLSKTMAMSAEKIGGAARPRWARTLVRLVEESPETSEQARFLRYARYLEKKITGSP